MQFDIFTCETFAGSVAVAPTPFHTVNMSHQTPSFSLIALISPSGGDHLLTLFLSTINKQGGCVPYQQIEKLKKKEKQQQQHLNVRTAN